MDSERSTVPTKSDGIAPLSKRGRYLVLVAAFLGWMFAGVEMSLLPMAARPAMTYFLTAQQAGSTSDSARAADSASDADSVVIADREQRIGQWFSWYICAFLLGAATGGLVFGWLGDHLGRVKAMGLSILCYSIVTGASFFATSPESLLLLRFFACFGIGGMWPSGVSLVAEAWPDVSRPMLAGYIGTSANVGILLLGLLATWISITPDSWRWVMLVGAAPAVLGVWVLMAVPESPRWIAGARQTAHSRRIPVAEVFQPPLLKRTLIGICLGTIPLLGAWGSGKWFIPWVDKAGGAAHPDWKGIAQTIWAVGAVLGSFSGGWVASRIGRRLSYFLISLGSLAISMFIFHVLTPTHALFFPAMFILGLIATLYFGWLPLFLPELFPTRVRATGSGVTFNFGRIASAGGVLIAGWLVTQFDGDYARVGALTCLIYAVGLFVIWLAPDKAVGNIADLDA